ncbi:MAG: hypothetical protein KAT74_06525, partial [Candidatus Cloacimonetes bacterium]|nr:hypothetical protein [Candidatus Cloacimonadota bacterium]
ITRLLANLGLSAISPQSGEIFVAQSACPVKCVAYLTGVSFGCKIGNKSKLCRSDINISKKL